MARMPFHQGKPAVFLKIGVSFKNAMFSAM
jgi:hypothetical protein